MGGCSPARPLPWYRMGRVVSIMLRPFYSLENTLRLPLNRRLVGPHKWSGLLEKRRLALSGDLPPIPRTSSPSASPTKDSACDLTKNNPAQSRHCFRHSLLQVHLLVIFGSVFRVFPSFLIFFQKTF